MFDTAGLLASVEGVLKDILLKLGVREASHVDDLDNDKRRKKLLKLTIAALKDLESGKAPASYYKNVDGLRDEGRAFSVGTAAEEDRACAALLRGMGVEGGRWAD